MTRRVVSILGLCLALAGCGDDDDSANSPGGAYLPYATPNCLSAKEVREEIDKLESGSASAAEIQAKPKLIRALRAARC